MSFPQRYAFNASLILVLAGCVVFASIGADNLLFGTWRRLSDNPVISPQGTTWESARTLNPAVIRHGGKYVMLYRAQDASGTSRLGYAESSDGRQFTRRSDPVLSPEAPYEKDG